MRDGFGLLIVWVLFVIYLVNSVDYVIVVCIGICCLIVIVWDVGFVGVLCLVVVLVFCFNVIISILTDFAFSGLRWLLVV